MSGKRIKAEHGPGTQITITMSAAKAAELWNELLWSAHDDDKAMRELFTALDHLNLDTR